MSVYIATKVARPSIKKKREIPQIAENRKEIRVSAKKRKDNMLADDKYKLDRNKSMKVNSIVKYSMKV